MANEGERIWKVGREAHGELAEMGALEEANVLGGRVRGLEVLDVALVLRP